MGGFQEGESMRCDDCMFLKEYRGSRDRWGLQLEPDYYECVGNASEDDIDKYFVEFEDGAENCKGFRCKHKEEEWE